MYSVDVNRFLQYIYQWLTRVLTFSWEKLFPPSTSSYFRPFLEYLVIFQETRSKPEKYEHSLISRFVAEDYLENLREHTERCDLFGK